MQKLNNYKKTQIIFFKILSINISKENLKNKRQIKNNN